jgi:hypothetical protein
MEVHGIVDVEDFSFRLKGKIPITPFFPEWAPQVVEKHQATLLATYRVD